MSLDWDVTGIENSEDVCFIEEGGKRRLNPVTEGIIFATMITGVGPGIDEHNIEEFVARVRVLEALNGALLDRTTSHGQEPYPITEAHLRAHLGLWTNVFYVERDSFLAQVTQRHFPRHEPNTRIYWVSFEDHDGIPHWEDEVHAKDGDDIEQLARKQAKDEGYEIPRRTKALIEEV